MVKVEFSSEVQSLIVDLGLVPVDSPEGQKIREDWLLYRVSPSDPVDPFSLDCQFFHVYDNLCELMYKRNRKFSRFAPFSFDLQLKLPF